MSRLMQFHENPVVIAWWCAYFSKVLAWLIPSRRRTILAIASIIIGVKIPLEYLDKAKGFAVPTDGLGATFMIFAIFGVLWLIYRAAAGFANLPAIVRRHPQLTLHLLFWASLFLLWETTPAVGAWRNVLLGVAFAFPFLLWRCGYMLMAGQHGRVAGTPFRDHLFYLLPAFGGSNTPYGKGFEYLSRTEAKTEGELARSQLAGLKLFVLYGCWVIVLNLFEGILYGPGNAITSALNGHTIIPHLSALIAQGGEAPVLASWASIYCELIRQVLRHAINGHAIIGILRLFGFNVFRNTYKPLLAESIVEFWNRYYYYFKELLVNFFFLPVFTQLGSRLRKWPNLRLFAAVFAAAFIGNMYYHMLQHESALVVGDIFGIVYTLRSRAFYCLLLAIGIFISMLRQQRGTASKAAPQNARILRIFGVWTFFSLIFIWNVRSNTPFFTRVDFFLNLFGLA
jgi:hypothetical protein